MTQSIYGIRDPQTYAVIGAAIEVHNALGQGFLEQPYKEALVVEFLARSIPHVRERELEISYKGVVLACTYRADFICYEDLLLEIKSVRELAPAHRAQTINYLRATRFPKALLINFGAERLEYERLVY